MVCQDIVIMVACFGFALALIPSILGKNKPARLSCLITNEERKVVFVSGPFRAETQWEILQNVRRAEEVSLRLIKQGYFPICPHTMSQNWQGVCPDKVFLAWCIALLGISHAIYMMDGWMFSAGSKDELAFALENDMEVIYE